MIKTGQDFLGQPPVRTQVCIVGTGPAGVTLAWYLVRKGIQVTLLEGSRVGSGRDPNAPVQQAYQYNENELLYNGEAKGLFESNEPEFLIRPTPAFPGPTKERERIYGGTSTHWGGQSRPLDPIVFEKRPGFPGWPITRQDLDPYYAEACDFCGLYGPYYAPDGSAGYNFTAQFWADRLGQKVADLDGFFVAMYQFFEDRQFQAKKVDGKTIGEREDACVILNASLLEMTTAGGSVQRLTVGVLSDDEQNPTQAGQFEVEADCVVLACGAVANARLMLLSDVGNEHDLVGRYFMGHPIANKDGIDANAVSTSPSYLSWEEQQLLSYQSRTEPGTNLYLVAGLLTPDDEATRRLETARCWFGPGGSGNFYHGLLPEADSRVQLSDGPRDVFGQQRTEITWVLNPGAQRNFEQLAGLFRDAVVAKGGGPVTIAEWSAVRERMVMNGHHIGTTRMAAEAENGVVDGNLKVHSLDNLYVAGSSVWASTGISNPTFSIITFSIRLAEHLSGLLKG